MASPSGASLGGVDADSSSVLLSSLRAVVSGADTAGYTAREFLRCVVSPRDLHHLRYWLQYEGAENPDRLLSDGNANLASQQETGATGERHFFALSYLHCVIPIPFLRQSELGLMIMFGSVSTGPRPRPRLRPSLCHPIYIHCNLSTAQYQHRHKNWGQTIWVCSHCQRPIAVSHLTFLFASAFHQHLPKYDPSLIVFRST